MKELRKRLKSQERYHITKRITSEAKSRANRKKKTLSKLKKILPFFALRIIFSWVWFKTLGLGKKERSLILLRNHEI